MKRLNPNPDQNLNSKPSAMLADCGCHTPRRGFLSGLLALGASAVCLGRPYVYGLAIAGEVGVVEVIGNVLAEFDLTLGLAG